ncbi:MAG: 30S ribosomal protein S7 [SAR202 cluster bacterium]|jgi:small subunit ribosomal protein S7|nr:30S ribosomal protein S7 [SAR202 cluster bacterium]MDP6301181.1 30S ribosomal protein S7 [SAR202 cluster bacterium]MDP7103643.1 30S ribosomal protein S7 [SAR202 cluster bacterium]MDP7225161.1 30S ribosomal protein S7 [SAR202 cluster bacterium]MDP7412516.1 30S ribosomal protein S7 [SAR202 cluster bacterium]|tara:strand:+ start:934 stop:1404 length:471 start_codon:yes stop_codon:yes gene_type:complete
MARRRRPEKRRIIPDPRFHNLELAQFINKVMLNGKKTTAQRIVYDALESAGETARRPGIEVFEMAIRNTMPMVEVKSRRVGGATYQVPTEVRPNRRLALAMRWLIAASRARSGRPMAEGLASELTEASRNQGAAVKRREDLSRMAEANRAFAHYRW